MMCTVRIEMFAAINTTHKSFSAEVVVDGRTVPLTLGPAEEKILNWSSQQEKQK